MTKIKTGLSKKKVSANKLCEAGFLGFFSRLSVRRVLVVLAIIAFTWGVFLRVYGLGEQSYWMDEAFSINAAQEIAEKGVPLLDSGEYYDRAYVYHYILAGFMWISDDPAVLRFPSVIFSLLAIWAVFGVARRLFPKSPEIAWITVIIMSLSYWDVAWARQVRMYSMLSFLTWAAFYFALCKSGSVWVKTVTVLGLFLLAYDSQKLAVLMLPALGLAMLFGLERQWVKMACLKYGRVFLVLFFLFFVTFFFGGFIYEKLYRLPEYGLWLFVNSLAVAIFPFLLVAIWEKKYLQVGIIFLAICFPVYSFLEFFAIGDYTTVAYRYAYYTYPVFYLATGACLVSIVTFFNCKLRTFFCVVLTFAVAYYGLTFYPTDLYSLESNSKQQDLIYYSYTPQTNFNNVYKLLSQYDFSPDTIVISTLPTLYKAYTDTSPDYALAANEFWESKIINRKDLYTGAPILKIDYRLKDVLQKHKALIIYDSFSLEDKSMHAFNAILDEVGTEVLLDDKFNEWSRIWVVETTPQSF